MALMTREKEAVGVAVAKIEAVGTREATVQRQPHRRLPAAIPEAVSLEPIRRVRRRRHREQLRQLRLKSYRLRRHGTLLQRPRAVHLLQRPGLSRRQLQRRLPQPRHPMSKCPVEVMTDRGRVVTGTGEETVTVSVIRRIAPRPTILRPISLILGGAHPGRLSRRCPASASSRRGQISRVNSPRTRAPARPAEIGRALPA